MLFQDLRAHTNDAFLLPRSELIKYTHTVNGITLTLGDDPLPGKLFIAFLLIHDSNVLSHTEQVL